ncbi:MAG: phosphatidylserine decarboxylase [Comamonadaceae bacterium]|jgi:phosphatidylserine decarboxylase|nr:phosphatidylserine decarboxylase [Comamonadaceae bacterium]
MSDRLKVLPQYLMPKLALTRLAGHCASKPLGRLTTATIRRFVARYGVNMAEAAEPDITAYKTFNDFFTRALRPGARPLADAPLICPVDGAISQVGRIQGEQIYQAKGRSFTTTALVGGDAELAERFQDGLFANLYLSPKDYHRIHMPAAGRLVRMVHVPGELFSVNPTTARGVPGLFARNERVVCVFDDDTLGRWVLVLVGATIVGSMATVWQGRIKRSGPVRDWDYAPGEVELARGDEMGRFLLGSTVVMLFENSGLQFNPAWQPGGAVRMGELMAR